MSISQNSGFSTFKKGLFGSSENYIFIFLFFYLCYILLLIKGGVCDCHMLQAMKNKRSLVQNDMGRAKRRRRRGRNKGKGRAQVYGQALGQLRKDVGMLFNFLNVEDKYIDISASAAAGTASWNFVILNTCNLGTTATTRNGQSIKWKGIELRWNCTMSTTTANQFFRLVLFVDTQPNAANATITDLYPLGVLTPRNVGYLQRFSIFYERTFALNPASDTCFIGECVKQIPMHTEFNTGNAGDITDITKNALYLAWYTSVAANPPTFAYNSRFVFIDN